jgi:exopolyphosphatase/guanosine-5'-triphosphate,3'-diphosphate pyrophosphatase
MECVRRAVIDVGTNSVKLLVADVIGRDLRPLHEESRQTRLGQGFYETHELQTDCIARTAEAVAAFAAVARSKGALHIRVIATSAARDARNARDLTEAISAAAGLTTEIISGAVEADLAFQGAVTDPNLTRWPLLLLDIGGGSTEFILGHGARQHFARSFPIGTVRLMEKFALHELPSEAAYEACRGWLKDFLHGEVRSSLGPALSRETGDIKLVGTGGTSTMLACIEEGLETFDRGRIDRCVLTADQVIARRASLWSLPLAERKKIVGLPPNRADVILPGVLIYEMVMQEFAFRQLRVSTRGLRFAAVLP